MNSTLPQTNRVHPFIVAAQVSGGGGQGGGRPGEKEAGGVREVGEEGAGSGRKEKNCATLRNISQSKKCKGAGAKKYRAGTGIKGYGKREV